MPSIYRLVRPSTAMVCLLVAALLGAAPAGAATIAKTDNKTADFFAGRTITIMVPTAIRSSYGAYAKLLKKFIARQIPGKPKIVLISMQGAGGAKGAAYAYEIAPRDGTYIAQVLPTSLMIPAIDKNKFDPRRVQWIGSITRRSAVLSVWHDSPVKSLEDAKRIPLLMASTGTGSETFMIPNLLNVLLGTKFKIIKNYKSDSMMNKAMEQGETQGRVQFWGDVATDNSDWIKNNRLRHLVQFGPDIKKLPAVPSLKDLVNTEEQRRMVRFIELANNIGMAFWYAPGVPLDRVRAVRTAFRNAMNDSIFFAEARRKKMSIDPMLGKNLKIIVDRAYELPQPLLKKLNAILGPMTEGAEPAPPAL